MPVISKQDASDVEEHIDRIFRSNSLEERISEIRRLFVETLDFEQSSGVVSLEDAPASVDLPATAYQIASLEDAHVVYVHLDTSRVRKAEASETARLVSNQLGGDILMVFTNDESSQLHLIYPTFEGVRPTLRRMVIERDLPRRTAVMQVSNIFHEWERAGSIHLALESAFDVEAVTREFFKEYKRVFDAALDNISGFGTDEAEQEAKKLFTQTLFNRLMFVFFISRKGWLSFNGDKDYLTALWRDYADRAGNMDGESNFRYDRLRPLFFGGLNNDGSQDLTAYPDARRLIGQVPFLNGGLFEETDLDRRTDLNVPDDVIRSIFDDLFDRFNFTVMESTPFDIEVAVDPEMLGKVFEELVTGRHESGSYYTPRPVVSFMCREAVKGYLEGRDTTLPTEAISVFVDDHDTSRRVGGRRPERGTRPGRDNRRRSSLRLRRLPARHDAGAGRASDRAVQRGTGRQEPLRPQAPDNRAKPVRRGHRRVRRQHRHAAPVAFARHRVRRPWRPAAVAQPGLQDSLRGTACWGRTPAPTTTETCSDTKSTASPADSPISRRDTWRQ